MGAIIIAENILRDSHFLSATEQAGPFVTQFVKGASNKGQFRPQASGDVADFTYSGTATADGNAGGTTIIDSVLQQFGDKYFIGASVLVTSGTYSGASGTVSNFAQSTGTITVSSSLGGKIVSGVHFSLTLSFSTASIIATLVAGGDAGTATFKWSHDGGATYLGRNSPNAATWLAERTVVSGVDPSTPVIQLSTGTMLMGYALTADKHVYVKRSTDNGITWGTAYDLFNNAPGTSGLRCFLELSTGRVLAFCSGGAAAADDLWLSDDDGLTWSQVGLSTRIYARQAMLLPNGNILAVCDPSLTHVTCVASSDGGATWGTEVTISDTTNSQLNPTVVLCKDNATLLCAYESDEDSLNDFEIKAKQSTDWGATWGSVIAVANFGGGDLAAPWLVKDFDGSLYCLYTNTLTEVDATRSTDNGATWGAGFQLTTSNGTSIRATLKRDGTFLVSFLATDLKFIQRGMWEYYSANPCTCAAGSAAQVLACGIEVTWFGSSGVAADTWTCGPGYQYAMENIIEDSPSKPWRSTQDNITTEIIIDMGQNCKLIVTGVAFFGCNIQSLKFQMDDTPTWSPPTIVNADIVFADGRFTGSSIGTVSGNNIEDSAFLASASAKPHELRGEVTKLLSGVEGGNVWRIADNTETYVILDTTASHAITTGDTEAIYRSAIAERLPVGGISRYIRIAVTSPQLTPEGYYQIGSMIAGEVLDFDRDWGCGYSKVYQYDEDPQRTENGGVYVIPGSEVKRVFKLTWRASEADYDRITALRSYLRGRNLALVPDSTIPTDCYLCKMTGDIELKHLFRTTYEFGITLEEVR